MQVSMKSTTEYESFGRLAANRNININHLSSLIRSIREKNLLHINPIIVNEKMELIDGQHRLEAARRLEVPIYYIKASGVTVSDVRLLNTNQKNWGIGDFLDSYISEGKEDYIILKEFAQKHNLTLSTAAAFLSITDNSTSVRYPSKVFKNGQFRVVDIDTSNQFFAFFREVARFGEGSASRDRDFLRATLRVFYNEEIKQDEFIKKLQKYPNPLYRRASLRDYLRQFEDVINYGERASGYVLLS